MDHLNLVAPGEFLVTNFTNQFHLEDSISAKGVYTNLESAKVGMELSEDPKSWLEVPSIKYNFHDFPEKRAGRKLNDDNEFELIPGMHTMPFQQFLQSWLFFGLLQTVIRLPSDEIVEDRDFVSDNLDYIHTTDLTRYLGRWADWECEDDQRGTLDQKLRMIRAQVALDRARQVVLQYCSVDGRRYRRLPEENPEHISDELSLSLMVIGETLTAAKSKIIKRVGFDIHGWHSDANQGWGFPYSLKRVMEKHNWCPRTIFMLKGQLRLHATSLLSAYNSHRSDEATQGTKHKDAKCTEMQCNVKSVNANGVYETQHHPNCPDHPNYTDAREKGTCVMVGPKVEEIVDALSGSYYPLLEYIKAEKDKGTKAEVKVVPYQPHMKYATISHVWADGYGNEDSNELWACQLNFFAHLLLKLDSKQSNKPLRFWIDTLAIPNKKSGHEEQRKTAIRRIHETYTNAKFTIVVDNGLTQANSGNDYQDAAMKILASGWMRRLWTLQEAYLSRKLLFAFKNNITNLDDIEDMYPEANDVLTSNIPNAARSYFHNMLGPDRRARVADLPPANGFGLLASVWKAAQWRTTAHPQHETLALATLLNLDNKNFVSGSFTSKDETQSKEKKQDLSIEPELLKDKILLEDEAKLELLMKDLWVQLDETAPGCIPPGVIFLPGKRLSIPGFGWAPLSWMSGQAVDYPDPLSIMTTATTLTDKGLRVQYPGILLHARSYTVIADVDRSFHFATDSTLSEWYSVTWREEAKRFEPIRRGKAELKQLAIILCRPRPREVPEIALLVEIMRTISQRSTVGRGDSKVYQVHFIRPVKIKREVGAHLLSEWRKKITQSIREFYDDQWRADDLESLREVSARAAGSIRRGKQKERNHGDSRAPLDVLSPADTLVFGEVLHSTQTWFVDGPPVSQKKSEPSITDETKPFTRLDDLAEAEREPASPEEPKFSFMRQMTNNLGGVLQGLLPLGTSASPVLESPQSIGIQTAPSPELVDGSNDMAGISSTVPEMELPAKQGTEVLKGNRNGESSHADRADAEGSSRDVRKPKKPLIHRLFGSGK